MSSLRLSKVAMCGLDIIKNFSEMPKLHRLVDWCMLLLLQGFST